jgi:hypothetical protein
MVVVAAGNNNGGDACAYSPSSAPAALAVAASNSQAREAGCFWAAETVMVLALSIKCPVVRFGVAWITVEVQCFAPHAGCDCTV